MTPSATTTPGTTPPDDTITGEVPATPPALPPILPPETPPPATPLPASGPLLPLREWRPLPARAYRVFLIVGLVVAVPAALGASLVLSGIEASDMARGVALAGVWVFALAMAFWAARRRHRYTFWLLDEDGFAVRRGRMWQWETRVPTSRVQHLDLKRGPIERAHGLASLVLHTAGTRLSAVSISGLEDADAEALRDHFSRQIERQDDDDHA